jgi:regulator of protease activity HflC (stomatin/prohibitin superfamily)
MVEGSTAEAVMTADTDTDATIRLEAPAPHRGHVGPCRILGGVSHTPFIRRFALTAALACSGCAVTIPPGHAGVLVTPSGAQPGVIEEGLAWFGPLSHVDVYDLRGQEQTEDLPAIAADGAPVLARASIVTYSLVRPELIALEREVGPRYYEVIIRPIVRASVRRVIAGYRSDELTPESIRSAQTKITALTAERVRPFHIIVASVDLRTLAFVLSNASYQVVTDSATEEQKALSAPQLLALANERAEERRVLGRAIANSHALVAPELSGQVLSDSATRAWTDLVVAPSTNVIAPAAGQPVRAEVTP